MQKNLSFIVDLKIAAIVILLFTSPKIFSEVTVPELTNRVMDQYGILDSIQVNALEDKLLSLETKKGSQLAILIISSTEGESIEQFSLRVVENWKLGRKSIDDGILILVAINDRKMRIEVGYGLEGILPDAICKRIISEQMKPHFKEKNYYEGIDNAVNSITSIINGEPLPPPVKRHGSKKTKSEGFGGVVFSGLFIILFGSWIGGKFASSFSRSIVSILFSVLGAFILVSQFGNAGFSSSFMGLILFVVFLFLLIFIILWLSQKFYNGDFDGYSGSSGSSWGSSSSSGGWSSSSDSFSGGGGSFGGGGSSGDW